MAAIASMPQFQSGSSTSWDVLVEPPEFAQGDDGRLLGDGLAAAAKRWQGPSAYVATLQARRKETSQTNWLLPAVCCLASAGLSGVALAFGLGGALRYSSAAAEEVWGPLMGLGGFVGGLLLLVALVGALSRRFGETNVQPLDIAVALHHRAGDKGESREEQGPDAITCVAYIDPNVTLDSVDAHLEVNEFTEWSELKNNGRRRRRFEVTAMRRISRLAGTSAPGEWRGVLAIPDEPLPPSIEDADGHGVIWQIAIVPKRPGVAREPERVVRRLQARLRAEPRATTT